MESMDFSTVGIPANFRFLMVAAQLQQLVSRWE